MVQYLKYSNSYHQLCTEPNYLSALQKLGISLFVIHCNTRWSGRCFIQSAFRKEKKRVRVILNLSCTLTYLELTQFLCVRPVRQRCTVSTQRHNSIVQVLLFLALNSKSETFMICRVRCNIFWDYNIISHQFIEKKI